MELANGQEDASCETIVFNLQQELEKEKNFSQDILMEN